MTMIAWHRHAVILLFLTSLFLPITAQASPPQQTPAISITYGDTVNGSISPEIPSVFYSFEGREGDIVSIAVDSTDGQLDPFVSLLTSGDIVLLSDDDGGGNTNALLETVLESSGTFIIEVTFSPIVEADRQSGPFSLTLSSINAIVVDDDSGETTTDTTTTTTAPPPVEPTNTIQTNSRVQQILVNSTITGSFSATQNFNVYWLFGSAGQQISIQPSFTSDVSPLIVIYDANLNEIVRNQANQPVETTFNDNSIYFIVAATLDAGISGGYSFDVIDAQPSPEDSLSEDYLVYGQTRTGVISNTNPNQRYRFTAQQGDVITITMNRVDGDLDAYLILANNIGVTVTEDDNSVGETDAQIFEYVAPQDGEYFIVATRRDQELGVTSGQFSLSITSDSPPRFPEDNSGQLPSEFVDLPQIAYGQTLGGEISDEQFLQPYVFYGSAGEQIRIDMVADNSALDSCLILLNENSIPIATNDDIEIGVVRDSEIIFTLPENGYYVIVATRYGNDCNEEENPTPTNSTGAYELSLVYEQANTELPEIEDINIEEIIFAEPVSPGETPNATFDALTLGDFFTFEAGAGTLIDFAVTVDGGLTATVLLLDNNLQLVGDSDRAAANGILLAATAPQSGQYYAMVVPQNGPAFSTDADYFVALNVEVGGANTDSGVTGVPVPITYNNTARGTITEFTTAIEYIFTGTSGDVITIDMTATGQPVVDTYLELYDAEGNLVAENDDIEPGVIRDSQIRTTLPIDGQYTIVATRFDDGATPTTVGDFELSVNRQDPATIGIDQSAEDIEYGETLTGEINDDTFVKFYFFIGSQGDRIGITINTTEGNLDGVLYLYTFTSNNEPLLLDANDDSPLGGTYNPYIEFTLPRSGSYLIGFTRYDDGTNDPTSGSFSINLELLDPPSLE